MNRRLPRELEQAPLVQHGGLTRKLVEALHIHGKVAAPVLGSEVMPVVVVEDLTRESFVSGFGEQKDGGGYSDVAPGVGLFGCSVLSNPATSNMVMLVEEVTVQVPTNQTVLLYVPGGARSINFAPYFRDSRVPGVPTATLTGENNLAVTDPGTIIGSAPGGIATLARFSPDFILGPGASLGVRVDLANTRQQATWKWIERPITKPNA